MAKRKWIIGLIVLAAIFGYVIVRFLSSTLAIERLVGQLETGTDAGKQQSRKHVVLIAQELDNPFWRTVEQGAKEAAAQRDMEIEYTGPIRINSSEQMRLLAKAIASKPDAILTQGINEPRYNELVSRAMDQGIPVITVDSDAPDSRRFAYVGTDNRAAGVQMGELVVQGSAYKGKIGIILGSELADNQRKRMEGFRSIIDQASGYEIVDVRSSNISRIEAAKQTKLMLSEHPDIRTIIGFSAWDAAGIVEGLQAAHKGKINVFGFDDVEATKRAIAHGDIVATLVQQPREIGAEAVSILQQIFAGEPYAATQYTSTKVLEQ
ncbi:LacI family transcriptional regulator [Paenibacillus sp. E194]|jgi:ribose transport system substrate-binding protein|uniref:Periplasmic binding protein/LacI transcriptional regulator n=1 Tax=Paenibacillus alvei TS-15 TaxID=1117108 RepID=S9SJG3_PAEAL|nr:MULTISPECIES: substrate-binding domain-containing protein [Paenibacillus]EPY05947.1 periplasmic binding protein/LacI transcriptional regulator [Paenibacillus alvei TS-15]KJB89438.1 LacI family transcriptional regulator [Paenibacillus sp. E194]